MSIRVHKLAKEFGITSKDLVERLKKLGVKVKGHMSSLDDETEEIVRHEIKGAAKGKETAAKREAPFVKDAPKKREAPLAAKIELKPLEAELPLTVKQLATKINAKPNDIIKILIKRQVFANINQNLSNEIALKIAEEYGYKIKNPPTMEEELLREHRESERRVAKESHAVRAPIVTFMGHVDHGKTSLLDYIRKTTTAAKEKGGITQHIGAYEISIEKKGQVTFLDTPGHAAFTAMRARGANATDIVVLVIAADDGIMPQTIEAIDHANAANAPIVVAINKCDLANINLDKVKRQLSERGLTPEDWGGKTITVPVSAKTGEGIDRLLEMLLLEAELLELKASPNLHARGVVIEGKLSPGQGPVATVLVKNGTLKTGNVILSGFHYGRLAALW